MPKPGRKKRYAFLIERLETGKYSPATIADLLTETDLTDFKEKHAGNDKLTLARYRLRARTALAITRRTHILTPSPGKVKTKSGPQDGWPADEWKKAFGLDEAS